MSILTGLAFQLDSALHGRRAADFEHALTSARALRLRGSGHKKPRTLPDAAWDVKSTIVQNFNQNRA
ncbi:hypothetical protein VUJ49_11075 [Pseudomonas berkeleyensis]|uniref:Uncharacterized protein n=1 Tax=Pseudomonas berkeleyensis TaxID=2726956 RepID=A0A7G5DUX2_9PSED|nr:hypothetical protein [Pseudomonas berkeleyensis]QMV65547.1 hypothetical protein HS968_11030 [Pseudomonas berkeleyensis]WSO41027.1 hypothetical protein VUJ49_11075 [Pseudomonas berkeleyensis]